MSNNKIYRLTSKILWPTMFLITIIKYAYYRYQYVPILDDNNMYGVFSKLSDVYHDVLMKYKMYTTRPVAAVLDAYFWSNFWGELGKALLIVTVLHFVSCYFIYKIFEKNNLKAGLPFIIIYILLPLGSEATYWLAASSRLVLGMFFTSLSLFLLCKYLEAANSSKKRYFFIALFFVIHLISLGFYEQIIALNFFSIVLLLWINRKKITSKAVYFLPFINFGLIAFWYKGFSSAGNMAQRGQLVSQNYFLHVKNVATAIYSIWKDSIVEMVQLSVVNGFKIAVADHTYIFIILIAIVGVLVSIISLYEKTTFNLKVSIIKFSLGVFLVLVPFAPFFIIQNYWICMRNLFPSFVGLGLVLSSIFDLFSNQKIIKTIKSAILGILVSALIFSNIYELNYYRNLGVIDYEVVHKLSGFIEKHSNTKLILFNAKNYYIHSNTKRLENCTSSDWALPGAIFVQGNYAKSVSIKALPVFNNTQMPIKLDKLKNFVLLGIDDDRNIFELTPKLEDDNHVYLYANNTLFGQIIAVDDESEIFTRKK